MNCRELTEILDNEKAALNPTQRLDAEAHIATCAECAQNWHLQADLADLPVMALPADFVSRCRILVARGAQNIPSRTGRRVLVGTLAALAAAAAVMALLPRPTAPTAPSAPTNKASVAEVHATAPVIGLESVDLAPEPLQVIAVEAPAKPKFTVSVVAPLPPLAPGSPASGTSSYFSPADAEAVRAYQSNPSRQQAVQAFHNALLDELRRIPGLTLVDPDQPIADPSGRNYRVTFGFSTQFGLDGKVMLGDGRVVSLGVTAEQLKPDGKNVRRLSSGVAIDLLAPCAGTPPVVDAPACRDPCGQAAEMARKLRQEVFPPDASVTRPLQARLQDPSQDASQRIKTLEDLFKLSRDHDDLALLREPGVVRAAIALAANGDPALRTQIWRMMRGVGNPDLIQPLLASLTQDPSDVRLAAIETLSADFLGDPRVRAALASTAVEDPRPLVRAVAERGISGEEPWRRYVDSSLKDSNQPAAQRVEALVYYLYPQGPTPQTSPNNPDYWQILEQLDDGAVRALAEALPKAGKLQRGIEGLFMSNFAGRKSKNPAVTEMLLGYLERDPQPRMRIIAGQTLARTQFADSRVR
ncbi:MAG: HEAT repeat domain-containing protein, partial [Pseudomonadota bacterium]